MVSSVETLDKGMTHIHTGQGGTAQDFVTLLRTAHNLKLMNGSFPELSKAYSQTVVDCG